MPTSVCIWRKDVREGVSAPPGASWRQPSPSWGRCPAPHRSSQWCAHAPATFLNLAIWRLQTASIKTLWNIDKVRAQEDVEDNIYSEIHTIGWYITYLGEEPLIVKKIFGHFPILNYLLKDLGALGNWLKTPDIWEDTLDDTQSGSPCFLLASSFFFRDISSLYSLWKHWGKWWEMCPASLIFIWAFPKVSPLLINRCQ